MWEDRAIMVNILKKPSSAQTSDEKIRDRLQIHFQRKKLGGGDVDKVKYPLQNHKSKAIVIFSIDAEIGKKIM